MNITGVRAKRRPVFLVFMAPAAGSYHLMTGNPRCAAPRYDLAGLAASLKTAPVSDIKVSPPSDNPSYAAPEVLAGVGEMGAALDVKDWRYRELVKLAHGGAQRLEPDLDLLSHAQSGLEDLRLMRGGKQLPYLLEHTSIYRPVLGVTLTVTNDVHAPMLSRWIVRMPTTRAPVTYLRFAVRTGLFQRNLQLYEELADERGEKYRRELGSATWTQTPGHTAEDFRLNLSGTPQSDTLYLETHNGDNAPIELTKAEAFYPVTRVVFKAQPDGELYLYYGNPQVGAPQYDLSLVAEQLLSAEKQSVTTGAEEQLRKASWAEGQTPGKGGVVFWGVLAVVVVVLLAIVARLLPKAEGK